MNPRRLDVEAWRDAILQVSGALEATLGGPSIDLDDPGNQRRTVYAKVSRSQPHALLRLYDFPDTTQHSPARDVTTTPLQQLFVMNSDFMERRAADLACSVQDLPGATDSERIRTLYRRILARDPQPDEIARAERFLSTAAERLGRPAWPEYAQALLGSNEFIFWE